MKTQPSAWLLTILLLGTFALLDTLLWNNRISFRFCAAVELPLIICALGLGIHDAVRSAFAGAMSNHRQSDEERDLRAREQTPKGKRPRIFGPLGYGFHGLAARLSSAERARRGAQVREATAEVEPGTLPEIDEADGTRTWNLGGVDKP